MASSQMISQYSLQRRNKNIEINYIILRALSLGLLPSLSVIAPSSTAHVPTRTCAHSTAEIQLYPCFPLSCSLSRCVDGQSKGTLIGVGVGVGVFLLLVLSTAVVLIVVVVVVKSKAVCKWNRNTATRKGCIQHTNTMIVMQEVKGNQKGAGYEDIDIYDIPDGYNLQNGKVEEDRPIADGCVQYENTGRMECTKKQAQKKSSTPARATIVHAVYAVTGVSNMITNQPHVKKPTEPEYGYFAKDNDLYAVPMMKRGRMTDNGEVVVVSGAMEEEQYDDTAQHAYRRW